MGPDHRMGEVLQMKLSLGFEEENRQTQKRWVQTDVLTLNFTSDVIPALSQASALCVINKIAKHSAS